MNSFTTLTKDPVTERYLDNNGTYFNVTKLYLENLSGVIDFGEIVLEEGVTTETTRVLEKNTIKGYIITDSLSGSFTSDASITCHAYDGASAGLPETVPGATQIQIFPSLVLSDHDNKVRDDIKDLNTSIVPIVAANTYYSSNIIINKDSVAGQISISGSATDPIILCRPSYVFYDEANITLDVTAVGNNQFIDIYVEDAGTTPLMTNTYTISLVGKASGTTPYTTAPAAGQFCIGAVYIKNNIIIGCHSLRQKQADQPSYFTEDAFGLTITSTSDYEYGVETFFVPVFKPGVLHWDINFQTNTHDDAGTTDWAYEAAISINDTLKDVRVIRKNPLPTVTKIGRIPPTLKGLIKVDTPQLLEIKLGGKINDLYTYSTEIQVTKVTGHFLTTYDQHFQPNLFDPTPPTSLTGSFTASKDDFASGSIYDIIPYNNKIYTTELDTSGGNNIGSLWEYDPVGDSWSQITTHTSAGSLYYTRMCNHKNKLYMGGIDSLAHNPYTRYDGSTLDRGMTFGSNVKYDCVSFNGYIYDDTTTPAAGAYLHGSETGDSGTFVQILDMDAADGNSIYTFQEWNGLLYFGTSAGKIFTCTGGVSAVNVATIKPAVFVRGMAVLDEFLIASADNIVKVTTDGLDWVSIPSPAMDRIDHLLVVNGILFACGGANADNSAKVFYTDRNFKEWNEIVVDAAVVHGYFSAMCYLDPYYYVVTRNKSGGGLNNKVYKGTIS